MLLVLIFALSNMGLAEVAEQVAESLPAAEPSVEEPVAEEVAPAEADEEEGDVADIPVEEDSAEPEAPAEGEADADDTADAEFEVEDAAPVAESVSVEVQEIDETSLCAYESIEPEGIYDVSYMWERAASAEGEWEALEETSDVYSTDAEDRFDYVYRCTVQVGDVTATSEPVAFSGANAAEAAPVMLDADFGLAQVNATSELQLTIGAPTESSASYVYEDNGVYVIIQKGSSTGYKFDLTVTDAAGELLDGTYKNLKFEVTNGSAAGNANLASIAVATGEATNVTVTATDPAPKITEGVPVSVKVTACKETEDAATDPTGTFELYLLPELPSDIAAKAYLNGVKVSDSDLKIGEGEEFELGFESSGAKVDLDAHYEIKPTIKVTNPSAEDAKKDVITETAVGSGKYKYNEAKGYQSSPVEFKVQATSTKQAELTVTESGAYTILQRPKTIKMKDAKEVAVDATEQSITLVPGNSEKTTATLELDVDPDSNVWLDEIKWTVTGNRWGSSDEKQVVTFDTGVEENQGRDDIKPGKLSVPITVNTDPTVPTSNVTITVTAKAWGENPEGAKKALDITPLTWNIKVLGAKTGLELTQEEIDLVPAEIGVPMEHTGKGQDWATFEASINDTELAEYGVKWEVDTSDDSDSKIEVVDSSKTDSTTKFTASEQSNYGTFFSTEEAATKGVKATVKASVITGPNTTVTQTKQVTLLPVAKEVALTINGTTVNPVPTGTTSNKNLPVGNKVTLKPTQTNTAITVMSGEQDKIKFKSKIKEFEIQQDLPSDSNKAQSDYTWSYTDDDDDTNDTLHLSATTGEIEWTPKEAATYVLTVTTDNGVSGRYVVKAQNLPASLELKAERTTLYPDKSDNDSTTLTVVAKGADGKEATDAYTDGLTWKFVTTGTTLDKAKYCESDVKDYEASPSGLKSLYLMKKAGGSPTDGYPMTVELHATQVSGADLTAILGGTLKFHVEYPSTVNSMQSNEVEISFKKAPTADAFAGAWTITDLQSGEFDEKGTIDGVYAADDVYRIAQGGSAKSKIDFSSDALKDLQGYEDDVIYSVTSTDTGLQNAPAEVAKWIEVDSNGNITVKAHEANKNDLSRDTQKHSFTVTAQIGGMTNLTDTRAIEVVSAPAKATIGFVDDQKEEQVFYNKIPATLASGDSIQLKVSLEGPKGADGNALPTLKTTATLEEKGSSGSLTRDTDANTPSKLLDTWTLTGKTGGSVVTITTNYPDITDDVSIQIWDNGSVPLPDGDTGYCSAHEGYKHVWQIVHVGDGDLVSKTYTKSGTEPLDKGHYYVCRYCHIVSKSPTAHTYKIVRNKDKKTGAEYTDDQILWTGKNLDGESTTQYGSVQCDVCQYECLHTNRGEYRSDNGYYHEFYCNDCKQWIKELHNAVSSGTCTLCGKSNAKPVFVNAKGEAVTEDTVVIGEDYVPRIEVENVVGRLSVAYSVDSASSPYIRVAGDEFDPVVQGIKPTGTAKAELTATVTINGSDTQVTQKLKLVVKNKVTAPAMDIGDGYIIDDGSVLKLSVNPGVDEPELSGFKWGFADNSGTYAASDSIIEFVKANPDAEAAKTTPYVSMNSNDLVGVTEVLIRVKDDADFESATKKDVTIYFGNAEIGDKKVACTGKIEALAQLENDYKTDKTSNGYPDDYSTRVTQAIALDDALLDTAHWSLGDNDTVSFKIVQGDTATVALKAKGTTYAADKKLVDFDGRLGSVRFEVVQDPKSGSGSETMTAGQVAKWATISNGKLTTKAATSDTQLSKDTPSVTFLVKATVTLHETYKDASDDNKIKNKTVVGYRRFEIVPKPAKVTIQVKTTQANGKEEFVDATTTDVMEGHKLIIQAVVTKPKDGSDEMETIDASNVKFTFPADTFDLPANQTEPTPNTDNPTQPYYELTVKKGVAADSFTISAECFGADITPLKVNVIRQFSGITVTADKSQIGAGEKYKDPVTDITPYTQSVTITAKGAPDTAKDDVKWKVYYEKLDDTTDKKPTGKPDESAEVPVSVIETKPGADQFQITFDVESTRTDTTAIANHGTGIVFVAEAVNSTNSDGSAVKGQTIVNLYQQPDSTAALELKTEKSLTTLTTGEKLILVAGERTLLTKHNYAKNYGYSGGTSLTPIVIDEKLPAVGSADPQTAEKGAVLKVEEDGDKMYLTAVGEGSATVLLKSYLSTSTDTYDPTHDLKLDVTVEAGIDKIERVESVKLPDPCEVSVGNTPLEISTDAFAAYRTVTVNGEEQPQSVSSVWIELKDPKGLATIERGTNATGKSVWKITGKTAGVTELVACVGDVECATKIPLTVNAKLEGIDFYQGETKLGPQIIQIAGKTEPITLTAKLNPTTARGTPEIEDPTTPNGFTTDFEVGKSTITVTPPTTGTGKMEITARVKNPSAPASGADLLNPDYLKTKIEIVVVNEDGSTDPEKPGPDDPEDPGIEIDSDIKIVGKSQIAENEKTELALVGFESNSTVQWSVAPTDAVTIEGTGLTAVVTGGSTAQPATITATVNGQSLSTTIEVLNPIKATANPGITMSANEELNFDPLDGKFFEGYTTAAGEIGDDTSNLFTISYGAKNSNKYLTIEQKTGEFGCRLVGKAKTGKKSSQKASIIVKPYNGAAVEIPVTVTTPNKGFTLGGLEGTTVVMGASESRAIPITFNPSTATINLKSVVLDEDYDIADGIELDTVTKTLKTDNAATGSYQVYVWAPGYDDDGTLSFDLEVSGSASETANLKLSLVKPGVNEKLEATTSVTMLKGEKLQASLVDDDGNTYSGATWTQSITNAKKQKVSVNNGLIKAVRAGKETVTVSAGTNSFSIEVTVKNAPGKSKVKMQPTATVRTVAFDEPFQLELALSGKTTYAGSGTAWNYVEWTGEAPEAVEGKPGWYVFSSDEGYTAEDSFTTSATLKTTWGYASKSVTFDVYGDYADPLSLPETIELPATGKTIVELDNADADAFANVNWTIGTKALTTVNKSVTIKSKKITAKLLTGGYAVEITTKNASGTLDIVATAVADPANTVSRTATIVPSGTAVMPTDAELLLDKPIIGVGEKISLDVSYPSGGKPIGNVTFKATPVSGKTKYATISGGNVLTGKKAGGEMEISVLLDGQPTSIPTQKVRVIPKAKITYSQKPTKMVVGETLTIGVTIDGYDKDPKANLTAEQKELVDTQNIVGNVVIKDRSMIDEIVIEPMPDENLKEDETNAHRYAVQLIAKQAKKNSKGKYTSTKVTITPQMGSKLSTNITVVDDDAVTGESTTVNFPDAIYIGAKETITLPISTIVGSTNKANIDWRFENPTEAASFGLSFVSNGKLAASKGASVGQTTNLIGTVQYSSEDEEIEDLEPITEIVPVYIGAKITSKDQFSVYIPKATIGLKEPVQAKVKFTNPKANASGKVTWKSSKTSVAAIDKNTGVITVKKAGKTTITATVGGKKNTFTLTVGSDMTGLHFDAVEKNVDTTNTWKMWDFVSLEGGALKADSDKKADETAFWFDYTENNILDDIDPQSGELSFIEGVKAGTALVTVHSYNDFSDTMLVVLGNGKTEGGSGEDTPPTPPVETKVPASIELRLNGETLTDTNNTFHIKEQQTITPQVIVRDAQGQVIENPDVEWTVTDESGEPSTKATVDKATGTMTANECTENKFNGGDDPVVITASVKGVSETPSYKVYIAAVMSELHFGLQDSTGKALEDKFTIINSQKLENLKFYIESDLLTETSMQTYTWKAESLNTDILAFASGSQANANGSSNAMDGDESNTQFTFESKKEGTAKIKVSVTFGTGATAKPPMEREYEVTVSALPTPEDITITPVVALDDKNTMTLASGETANFTVTLPERFGANPTIDVRPYKLVGTEKKDLESGEKTSMGDAVRAGTTGNTFTVTGGTAVGSSFYVEVKAFGQAKITKDFQVKVVDAVKYMDDVKITTTPEQTLVGSGDPKNITVYAGVGEQVKLNVVPATAKTWKQGLKWKKTDENAGSSLTAADKAKFKPTVNTDTLGEATISSEYPGTVELKIELQSAKTTKDTVATTASISDTVKVVFLPIPTASTAGDAKIQYQYKDGATELTDKSNTTTLAPASGTIVLGVDERLSLSVDFGGDAAAGTDPTAYTNNVVWSDNTNGANIRYGTDSKTGKTIDIFGKAKTQTTGGQTGTMTLTAKTTTGVTLGTVTLQIVDKPTAETVELKSTDKGATTTKSLDTTLQKQKYLGNTDADKYYVTADIGTDTSSTLELICQNPGVKIERVDPAKKNLWALSFSGLSFSGTSKTISLTLQSKDQKIKETFPLKVVSEMTLSNGTKVEEYKAEEFCPQALLDNATNKGAGLTAEKVAENQNAVGVGIAAGDDDDTSVITLTYNESDLNEWTSTAADQGKSKWYLLIIDTGFGTYEDVKIKWNDSGAPRLLTEDEKGGEALGVEPGCLTLWLKLSSHPARSKIEVTNKENVTKKFTIEYKAATP